MNPENSQDLFNKIRSQFSNIRLGDENGAATANLADAVFFEFEFREDADTFGAVSISLADGENMKVYYNRDLVSKIDEDSRDCLLYTSPSPRDVEESRMPSSA